MCGRSLHGRRGSTLITLCSFMSILRRESEIGSSSWASGLPAVYLRSARCERTHMRGSTSHRQCRTQKRERHSKEFVTPAKRLQSRPLGHLKPAFEHTTSRSHGQDRSGPSTACLVTPGRTTKHNETIQTPVVCPSTRLPRTRAVTPARRRRQAQENFPCTLYHETFASTCALRSQCCRPPRVGQRSAYPADNNHVVE